MKIEKQYSLKSFNTMGVEAFAEHFAPLSELDELAKLEALPKPLFVLGGGSNLLLCRDIDGTVLHNRLKGIHLLNETDEAVQVEVMGGENWHEWVTYALKKGWHGLEPLALIPGTVGASPVQNIGAYGYEVGEFIETVKAFDLTEYREVEFTREQCEFSYRDSLFKANRGRYLITSVVFNLKKSKVVEIRYPVVQRYLEAEGIEERTPFTIYSAVIAIRRSKLPDPKVIGNAGSFFKNPIISNSTWRLLLTHEPDLVHYKTADDRVKLAAGQLIDLAGFKGAREGDAGMYEKQALILVNHGNATGEALYQFSEKVADAVEARFGVRLEAEPLIIR